MKRHSVLRVIAKLVIPFILIFALYVPLALLGSRLLELRGIFGAGLVANGIAGVAAYLWARRTLSLRHAEDIELSGVVPVMEPSEGGV